MSAKGMCRAESTLADVFRESFQFYSNIKLEEDTKLLKIPFRHVLRLVKIL